MFRNEFELVSVVIPTHNRQPLLEKAIESARAQTWPNIEIIVIDDASRDSTSTYLKHEAEADPRVRFLRHETAKGGAASRNAGISLALGTYVAFLDDDDLWLPEKLQKQISLLKSHPSASAVSCSFMVEDSSGKKTFQPISEPFDWQEVLKSNKLGGASMCLTTKAMLDQIGGFDPQLRSGQDWELWIKLYNKGPVLVCPEPLVRYQSHDGTRITTNPKSAYLGRRRIFFKYRNNLNSANRKHHLRDLAYLRIIPLVSSRFRRWHGLYRILIMTDVQYGLRCLYRLCKLELTK